MEKKTMLLSASALLGVGTAFLVIYVAMTAPLVLLGVPTFFLILFLMIIISPNFSKSLEPYAGRIINYIFPFFVGMLVSITPAVIILASIM